METLVKEIIFEKEKKDFRKPFGHAIDWCEKKGYLTDVEIKFLRQFKDKIRNPYQHVDVKKIVGESKARGWRIPLEKGKGAESLLSLLKGVEKVVKGEAGSGELMGYKDSRVIGTIIKGTVDKKRTLPLFLNVEKFVRDLSTKHFKV